MNCPEVRRAGWQGKQYPRGGEKNGYIRWFSGFGWEGQGDITTAEQWTPYLKKSSAKFTQAPYAEPSFKVHTLGLPAEAQAVTTPATKVIEPKAE